MADVLSTLPRTVKDITRIRIYVRNVIIQVEESSEMRKTSIVRKSLRLRIVKLTKQIRMNVVFVMMSST